jgi:hypothetical protein
MIVDASPSVPPSSIGFWYTRVVQHRSVCAVQGATVVIAAKRSCDPAQVLFLGYFWMRLDDWMGKPIQSICYTGITRATSWRYLSRDAIFSNWPAERLCKSVDMLCISWQEASYISCLHSSQEQNTGPGIHFPCKPTRPFFFRVFVLAQNSTPCTLSALMIWKRDF